MVARTVLLGLLLIAPSVRAHAQRQNDLTSRIAPMRHPGVRLLGAASCAATACHGGARPGATVADRPTGAEHATWIGVDPHARAAWKLATPRSLQILKNLGISRNGRMVDRAGYQNCLNCHGPGDSLVGDAQQLKRGSRSQMTSRGVDCEACHGPARDWIASHVIEGQRPAVAEGKVRTSGLLTRARMCAQCHVGGDDRDVNHDLIAAGHPALRFEFTQYHNRLPKHWRETAAGHDDFQQQLWLAGQIAVSEAALALTAARADRNRASTVWPEFAEFQCSACHQPFQSGERQTARAAWGDWTHASIRQLSRNESSESGTSFAASIEALATETQRNDFGRADEVRRLAKHARQRLNEWLVSKPSRLRRIESPLGSLRRAVDGPDIVRQEFATQVLLGMVALERNQRDGDGKWTADVRRLHKLLRSSGLSGSFASSDQKYQQQLRSAFQELLP